MITVQSGYATDIGRLRTVNQDSFLAAGSVFAVADGMGGHAAGEVASRLAIQRLARLAERGEVRPDDVRGVLVAANDDILAQVRQNPEQDGMGTTIAGLGVVCVAGADHWVVFNVGDSRVYRFVGGVLAQLTVDHTEVAELVASGAVAIEDARTHPRRHVVTRALGSDPAPEPDVWLFPPTAGERFLICSDGLILELGEAEIVTVLGAERDPQRAAEALVGRAKAYGGRDDVTAVVVDYVTEARASLDDTVPRTRTESVG
ncbi:MAG TPA: protein phosphatase 2C domain-containing protein [Micromonosporaceae bacterium]